MLYSRTAKYGLKTMAYLAGNSNREYQTVSEISKRTDVPRDFLGKIFQQIAREGLLESQRGRGGGFRLDRPANEISLMEIIEAIDGKKVFDRCPFDLKDCGQNSTCPLHEDWKPIRDQIVQLMKKKTIDDLSEN